MGWNISNVVRFVHELVRKIVLCKRNCAVLGEWLPSVHYLEAFGVIFLSATCPESRSIRFSEVANVLQLWYFQSVTQEVSFVVWVSASRRLLMFYSYGIFNL